MPTDKCRVDNDNGSRTKFLAHNFNYYKPGWDKVVVRVFDILLYKVGKFVLKQVSAIIR